MATRHQKEELEWIKEELRNMFATNAYNRLLYDVFTDSDRFDSIDLTSTRRALFFVFDDFEKLLSWGQKDYAMFYDPITVKIFDLNVVINAFGFKGRFLKTVTASLNTPSSLCVFISVRCEEGFQTLYGGAYLGKESRESKEDRLAHFGSRCNLTFNCENMDAPNAAIDHQNEYADVAPVKAISNSAVMDSKILKNDTEPYFWVPDSSVPGGGKYARWGLRCKTCNKRDAKLFRCTGCKIVYYCGRECQRVDWNYHRETCQI